MEFQERLGAAAAPDTDVRPRRVKPEARTLADDDPAEVFARGHFEGVADGREIGEARRGQFGGFVLPQQHGDGDAVALRSGAEQLRDLIHALGGEAESLQQRVALVRERGPGTLGGSVPVELVALADDFEFVRGEEAFVAQAGQARIERRQCITQPAQRGVAVRLSEGLAAEALGLAGVEIRVNGRFVTGGAAKGGFVVVKDSEQQRRGAAALTGFPNGTQVWRARLAGRISDDDLQRRCAQTQREATQRERAFRRERDGAKTQAGKVEFGPLAGGIHRQSGGRVRRSAGHPSVKLPAVKPGARLPGARGQASNLGKARA